MSMDALARLREWVEPILQNKYSRVGFFIILFIVALAIGAPVIAPRHYAEVDPQNRLKPPSLQHLFGTDELGRDVFSRVVYGARIALWVGMLVVFIEAAIGVTLGMLAGYYGGKVDKVISAVTDMVWAFPPLVLALGVVTLIGPGLVNVVTAVAIVSWPTFTRIVRAKVQSLVNREFVLAARAIGESDLNIMLRYLLPNVVPTIIVIAALSIPSAILSTTALSFLGFGAQPPTPDWGAMVSNGMPQLPRAPWVSSFPGIFIVITCLGFNLLGDGLRDILDPKLKV